MAENVIAVFIPIVIFLVTGLVLVTFFYLRSREKQMLIDKGLNADSIKEFYERKIDPYRMLKIGIVVIGFGLGIGIGMMLQEYTQKDFWLVLFLFTFTGIGFVVASAVANKLKKE